MKFNNTKIFFSALLLVSMMLSLSGCGGGSGGGSGSAATDTTPPTISSVTPANSATGVAANSAVTATFSEAMTTSTLNAATFTLSGGASGTITYSGTTATFTPSSSLAYSTNYTATITTGAKDSAGNALAANYTWSFTTGAAPSVSATEVTISASATSGGTWSGAIPDVFTPNAPAANVAVTDIQTRLNAGTAVTITTSTAVGGNGDISVNNPVSWNASALTLSAERDVIVNAVMTVSSTSTLSLNHASFGGVLKMGFNADGTFKGRVDFLTRTGANILTIGGYGYTIINDVNALQNMCLTSSCMYAIGSNIDASATATWNANAGFVPVGTGPAASYVSFNGRFDGLGHTITGLTIKRPATSYVGLFGFTNGAKIRNVGLVAGSIIGFDYVGGLVGQTWTGSDIISNSYNTSDVTGDVSSGSVGGLIGFSYGSINRSYNTGIVSGGMIVGGLAGKSAGTGGLISDSYNTGAVIGTGGFIGGLVGENGGGNGAAISNSYSVGSVTGTDSVGGLVGYNWYGNITHSYSTGSVTGSNNVGGLVGWSGFGAATNSYWNTTTSGQASSFIGSGLTTSQMKAQASFTGWDFVNTWSIVEGVSYPTLKSFE